MENKELIGYKLFIKNITNNNNIKELKKYYIEKYKCNKTILDLIYQQSINKTKLEVLYKNSITSYKKILNTYKELAIELDINNSLELSILYSYLLWNGYFSITHEHKYNFKNNLFLPGMPFEIITGNGVCIQNATMLRDFLDINNIKSSTISSIVKKDSIKEKYQPNIERNIPRKISNIMYKTFDILKPLVDKYGNHLLTLIEDDKYLFIYDSTKQYVYNIKDGNTLEIINGEGTVKIKTIPTLILDPSNDKNNILNKIYTNNKKNHSIEEVILTYEKIIDLLDYNKYLLNDVYIETIYDINLINNEINKYGNFNKSLKLIKNIDKNK